MKRLLLLVSILLIPSVSLSGPKAEKAKLKASAPPQAPVINRASLELNEDGSKAMQAKDFVKAESLFREALKTDPRNITAAFNLAGACLMNNKNDDAIQLLKGYIAEYPRDPGLYSRLGEAYFTNKDLPNAEANFKKALEIFPAYPGLAAKLGTVYALQQKFPEAEKTFLIAVEQDPRNGEILSSLANIFLANRKPKEAVSTAKRALQVKPSSDVYVTMGLAYETLNDYGNAVISLQRAVDLGDTRDGLREKIDSMKARGSQAAIQ